MITIPVFTPPTANDMASVLPTTSGVQRSLFRYYAGNPRGQSVLLISGHYVLTPNPSSDQLDAAGVEGVGWFLGGHTYVVSGTVQTALVADGFGAWIV